MKSDFNMDFHSGVPFYRQIGNSMISLIESGSLKSGDKLPSIRDLASEAGVTPGTVAAAYRFLESRHIVYTRTGSGTFVAERESSEGFMPFVPIKDEVKKQDVKIDFASSDVREELFPVRDFKQAIDAVLEEEKGRAFRYENPRGSLRLRASIGERLGCSAERIQIISGAQQGIDIIARAALSYGDIVFTEKPTYPGAAGSFISRGAEVVPVELLSDGMDMERLESLVKTYKPSLVYVMTRFQTPTTVSYTAVNKRKLIELSYKYNFYILEDDTLSDFDYSDKSSVSLKSLDYKNRVIYLKSFSKILMPGLRLGCMVMPKAISERVLKIKYSADMGSPGFIQSAFDRYIKSGGYDRHRLKIKNYYKKKYEIVGELLKEYLKDRVEFDMPGGGLSFWIRLKNGSGCELREELLKNDVLIETADSFYFGDEFKSFFRLSFADISADDIKQGIAHIAAALKKLF